MASAKEYTTDKIRNVVVLGHGGAGKTTLVDALCFTAGTSKRKGNVSEGHALTMYTEEEAKHGISLQCTPAFCEHLGSKINLLDTPGFMDFVGETLAAIRVADSAVIVVSATSGVEVGTETVWEHAESRGIPRLFFVSMMDKENASFERTYQEIKSRMTEKVVPVEIPIGEGPDFRGIINLFSGRAHLYKAGTQTGEYEESDPRDGQIREMKLRQQFDSLKRQQEQELYQKRLLEQQDQIVTERADEIIGTSDALAEKYNTFSSEELVIAFSKTDDVSLDDLAKGIHQSRLKSYRKHLSRGRPNDAPSPMRTQGARINTSGHSADDMVQFLESLTGDKK